MTPIRQFFAFLGCLLDLVGGIPSNIVLWRSAPWRRGWGRMAALGGMLAVAWGFTGLVVYWIWRAYSGWQPGLGAQVVQGMASAAAPAMQVLAMAGGALLAAPCMILFGWAPDQREKAEDLRLTLLPMREMAFGGQFWGWVALALCVGPAVAIGLVSYVLFWILHYRMVPGGNPYYFSRYLEFSGDQMLLWLGLCMSAAGSCWCAVPRRRWIAILTTPIVLTLLLVPFLLVCHGLEQIVRGGTQYAEIDGMWRLNVPAWQLALAEVLSGGATSLLTAYLCYRMGRFAGLRYFAAVEGEALRRTSWTAMEAAGWTQPEERAAALWPHLWRLLRLAPMWWRAMPVAAMLAMATAGLGVWARFAAGKGFEGSLADALLGPVAAFCFMLYSVILALRQRPGREPIPVLTGSYLLGAFCVWLLVAVPAALLALAYPLWTEFARAGGLGYSFVLTSSGHVGQAIYMALFALLAVVALQASPPDAKGVRVWVLCILAVEVVTSTLGGDPTWAAGNYADGSDRTEQIVASLYLLVLLLAPAPLLQRLHRRRALDTAEPHVAV